MPNSDERSQAVESLIERVFRRGNRRIALHEARGWPRDELDNRVSEELYALLQARWSEDDEQIEQVKPSSDS